MLPGCAAPEEAARGPCSQPCVMWRELLWLLKTSWQRNEVLLGLFDLPLHKHGQNSSSGTTEQQQHSFQPLGWTATVSWTLVKWVSAPAFDTSPSKRERDTCIGCIHTQILHFDMLGTSRHGLLKAHMLARATFSIQSWARLPSAFAENIIQGQMHLYFIKHFMDQLDSPDGFSDLL